MGTRTCRLCDNEKALGEFPLRNKATGKRGNHCKECQKVYARAHYKANKSAHNARRLVNQRRYRQRNREYVVAYLKTHPCVDCGEPDPVVLTFDHVRGVEEAHVSTLTHAGVPLRRLKEEIAKCEVRCANCHTRKTVRENDWGRNIGV